MTREEALAGVETPVGVVDLERVRANAEGVVTYLRRHGLAWRPHVKTHKSLDVAKLQLEAGAAGLTVATPHEAEVMSHVCDDLLLAYPPVGASKVKRVITLPEHVTLRVGLDSAEALDPLAAAADAEGRSVGILVEFDAGLGRVGVQEPAEAVRLAERAAATPGSRFDGLMFYPGHIRLPVAEQDGLLEELSEKIGAFVSALEQAGLPPRVVSGGSTPTLFQSHRLAHLTEVRPGTAIYQDRDILAMGACAPDGLAYSVLATVVSTSVPGRAVVDAGSKALAKETFRSGGEGYGVLLGRPEVRLSALSEEHGILDLGATDWRPRVGDRVRVVPNHVCVSVNLQDRVLGLDGSQAEWMMLDGRGRGPYPTAAPPGR